MVFIDIEKAYDRIPRATLWRALAEELEIPQDIYEGILALYHDTQSQVRVGSALSAPFKVNTGVKQGCPASPLIFGLFFERVTAYLCEHAPTRLRQRCPYLAQLATCILLYADDVVLMTSSSERL